MLQITTSATEGNSLISNPEFQELSEVPHVVEWLANFANKRTRENYRKDVEQFIQCVGMTHHTEFKAVARPHVIKWRDDLVKEGCSASTIRRKLAALSSLFNYLCEKNSVNLNPVAGVQRPKEGANEGKTPSLSQEQTRKLLDAPPSDTIKGLRDRAILAVGG